MNEHVVMVKKGSEWRICEERDYECVVKCVLSVLLHTHIY